MTEAAFEFGEELYLRKVKYILHQNLWTMYDLSAIDLNLTSWTVIKYLNDTADDFSQDIDLLPNNKGGLYMFFIKCPVIIGITEYPFYIGRAQLTEGQNLRKRCREYFTTYSRDNERPKITKMFRYWGKDLYLAFKEIDDNSDIIDFEKKLINSLLLPMNDEIPDKEIKEPVKAFRE